MDCILFLCLYNMSCNYELTRRKFMETFVGIMEMMMVVCFGISWPLNISKAWKSKSTNGISLPFYLLIWVGYVFALLGKFVSIHLNAPNPWYMTVPWYVMIFYINGIHIDTNMLILNYHQPLDVYTK